jgi:polyisoprenoid-binding protein YceI
LTQGTHSFGPHDGALSVRTGRTGAAARAGHDLLIAVTSWEARLELATDPAQSSLVLTADAASLRVLEGTGGMQSLGDDDRASIVKTIDDDVLKGTVIEFRSTGVRLAQDGSTINVRGELTLAGNTSPIEFDLHLDRDGRLGGRAVLKQTDWGIKPYSTLFGALKVADEVAVEVAVEVSLDAAGASGG